MATEPITGLTYQEANMLQTDVLQNEQLNYFSVWVNARALSVGTNTPPVSPSEGDCHVVGTSPTGAWASASNKVAVFRTSWQFLTPSKGAYVMNAADGNFWRYLSGVWTLYAPVPNAAGVDYDNAASGLAADDVQAAIDELAAAGSGAVSSVNGATGAVTVYAPIIIACSDETTALTTGTAKVTFRMPYAFTLTAVRASVTTAPTGSVLTVDINESGTSILSTKLTIDAGEKTSTTAATAAVISDSSLADDAEITIDIDSIGSTIAGAGLKVTLIGYKP